MSRPDARLLVPVECLPFVPSGARIWMGDVASYVVDDIPGDEPVRVWKRDGSVLVFARTDAMLDLSAPALRDGVPGRLDALPWALGLLRRGVDGIHMDEDGSAVLTDCGEPVLAYNDPASRHMRCTIDEDLTPWPDLSGLSDGDASRAVVAAALRGGR